MELALRSSTHLATRPGQCWNRGCRHQGRAARQFSAAASALRRGLDTRRKEPAQGNVQATSRSVGGSIRGATIAGLCSPLCGADDGSKPRSGAFGFFGPPHRGEPSYQAPADRTFAKCDRSQLTSRTRKSVWGWVEKCLNAGKGDAVAARTTGHLPSNAPQYGQPYL